MREEGGVLILEPGDKERMQAAGWVFEPPVPLPCSLVDDLREAHERRIAAMPEAERLAYVQRLADIYEEWRRSVCAPSEP